MATHDLVSNLDQRASLRPDVYNTSGAGLSVDLQGFEGAMMLYEASTVVDTHVLTLQESDDDSAWNDVPIGEFQGVNPFTIVTDGGTRVGYVGFKRYIRTNRTLSGGAPTGTYMAIVVRGRPRHSEDV